MKKGIASLGIILILVAAFLFYIVFAGGRLDGLVITGANATANFIAFLYVIIALPIGSALAYIGIAFRGPIYAAGGQPPMPSRGSSVGTAGLAIGIVALIIAFAAIGVSIAYQPSASGPAVSSLSSQVSSLSSQVSSLKANGASGNLSTVNQKPTTVAEKIDWCNADNTGQDRFCPPIFVVNQGDIVQIMFISNDSDIHTFTLITNPYSFQINVSAAGMHDFLTNGNAQGNCSNSGTPSQETAGVSGVYCVSGTSLLTPSQLNSTGSFDFRVPQNPTPAQAFANGSSPIILHVDNQVHYNNISSDSPANWGIAAFQATSPGIYEFFCHYHVSNGMFGYMIVLPNTYCNTHTSECNIAGS